MEHNMELIFSQLYDSITQKLFTNDNKRLFQVH